MKFILFPVLSLFLVSAQAEPTWKPLFNGKDLTGWDTLIRGQTVNEDPDGNVTIHDGMVHMYQNVPEGDTVVPFGVIMTKDSFSKFHLRLEYKWLGKRFRPRKEKLRDAGLLYHCHGEKKVWPLSVESQIQEGDSGDIVTIDSSALTWMHPRPDIARPGQGLAGYLPEYGGVLWNFPNSENPGYGYIGRFPENDNNTGWNVVEAVVHADEYAVNIINGTVTSRVLDMRVKDGSRKLTEGPIALQLEGAELVYRNIEIKELDGYLRPSSYHLAFSRVADLKSQTQSVTITNTSTRSLDITPVTIGKNPAAFEVLTDDITPLIAGESREFTVEFFPDFGPGSYAAGIQFGPLDTGAFVQLSAIATKTLEGDGEPTLHRIAQALGSTVDVGGTSLEIDTKPLTIGHSISPKSFSPIEGEKISITPLARYSKKGSLTFGFYDQSSKKRFNLTTLGDSTGAHPDAHQCLLPPASKVTFPPSLPKQFHFHLSGNQIDSTTETGKNLAHQKARVYPVQTLLNRRLKNAYLLCFEDYQNGDYQDAVFLVEGVTAN